MKKKIFCVFFALLLIVNLTLCNYKQAQAVWIAPAVPAGLEVLVDVLIGVGLAVGVIACDKQVDWTNMTDEEKIKAYNEEQQYLQSMQTYMIDGSFGSTEYCSVMTADGQVLTLAEALETATSMSQTEYIDMRKETNSPNPTKTPGINWGEIFIDSAVGGLMDFVADFLTNLKTKDDGYTYPATFYTGDSGYINRSTGELNVFLEYDTLNASRTGAVKHGKLIEYNTNLSNLTNYPDKSKFRMCVVIGAGATRYYDSSGTSCGFSIDTPFKPDSLSAAVVGSHEFSVWSNACSGSSIIATRCGLFSYSVPYAFKADDYKAFYYFSTNLPIFDTVEAAKGYLLNSTLSTTVKPAIYPTIRTTCNNYKNKVVSVNSVRSYGVTPTPKPTATPRPTATSTPSPTPTPTPYPTWDKNSGNGTNFTNYNFYTEITNNFTNVQTTLNNISQSITNIYNFFQIDTQEISCEMDFDSPAYKFDSVNESISSLKSAIGNDAYDENTGLLKVNYPKISMKCPKILAPVVDSVGEDGEKEIVIVDFKDYALWFVRLRKFLEAIMWIGMVFLLMKEIKVIFTV